MSETDQAPGASQGVIMRRDEVVVREYVEEGRRRVAQNSDDIQVRILADALRAETMGELLSPKAVEGADAVLNKALEIDSFDLNESEHKSGLGFYAIFSAEVLNEGRRTTVQCGAPEVVLKLMHAERLGGFPIQAKIVELNEGKEGRNPALGLVALDAFDVADLDDNKPDGARDR